MDLSVSAQTCVNVVLLWVGFSVVVGLLAQAFLPNERSYGVWGTLVVGMMGTCVGPAVFAAIRPTEHFNPISPFGLFVSVVAAFVLLLIVRSGKVFFEQRKKESEAFGGAQK